MKHFQLVLNGLAVLGLLVFPVRDLCAACKVSKVTVVEAKPCSCSANTCPGSAHGLIVYTVCGDAVPGQSGSVECFESLKTVGTAYACNGENNVMAILGCMAGNVGCVAVCVGITTTTVGLGLTACLSCFAALGIACGRDCVVVTCVVDQDISSPVIWQALDHFSGKDCEGEGGG